MMHLMQLFFFSVYFEINIWISVIFLNTIFKLYFLVQLAALPPTLQNKELLCNGTLKLFILTEPWVVTFSNSIACQYRDLKLDPKENNECEKKKKSGETSGVNH